MRTSNYRGYTIYLNPVGIDWQARIRWLGTACFQSLEKSRFSDVDTAFTRACEVIDEVLNVPH